MEPVVTAYTIDEDAALANLIAQIPKGRFKHVVSTGRGGAYVAAQVAYAINAKLYIAPYMQHFPEAIFIDDIEDTSKTVASAGMPAGVLVQKAPSWELSEFVGVVVDTKEYVEFSFQSKENK